MIEDLLRRGSCDSSYTLTDKARFRVNIFSQRGNYSIVCRKLNTIIPTLEELKLPEIIQADPGEKTGLVLVTGATGSGKSTTLAACSTRSTTPSRSTSSRWRTRSSSFIRRCRPRSTSGNWAPTSTPSPTACARRLRQAPKVILVGEMRDRETVKIALSAAETGHLVLSTLHTIDAGQTINRILGMFEPEEQEQVRSRLADTLRWVVSQRLVPKVGGGRYALARNHGRQPAHPGKHPPGRKRRQELLRNHRGQLHLRLAHLRPRLPRSLRSRARSPKKPPCSTAPNAVRSRAASTTSRKTRGESTTDVSGLRMKAEAPAAQAEPPPIPLTLKLK